MYPKERSRTEDEIQFHARFSSREWTFFSHLGLKKSYTYDKWNK